MPTTEEVNEASANFIADTVTANAKINGAAGLVTDRHGTTTKNLQQILADLENSTGLQPFPNRTTAQAANIPAPVNVITVLSGNYILWYIKDAGGTSLTTADGSNWSPTNEVTPLHWGAVGDGVTDDTTAFQGWWAYLESLTSAVGNQYSGTDQVAGYIPNGHYFSSAGLVLVTSSTGFSVYGDGPMTQLDRIDFRFERAWRGSLRFMFLRGQTAVGIECTNQSTALARENDFIGIHIRDKTEAGIKLDGSVWNRFNNCEISRNEVGILVLATSGDTVVNSTVVQSFSHNIALYSGGEFKMDACHVMQAGFLGTASAIGAVNLLLSGDATTACVEHYFTNVTFTTAANGNRRYTISSITNNGAGKLRVVTTTPHELAEGQTRVTLQSTGYTTAESVVLAVNSATSFDLDVNYISDEASGEVWLPGWDVLVECDTDTQQVNDMWFTNCNINHLKINGGFNLNFTGCRLKESIYIDDGVPCNRVFFIRNTRGRQFDSTADLPVYGPGADQGWGEVAMLDTVSGFPANGGEAISIRLPNTADGLTAAGQVVSYNAVEVAHDELGLSVGGNRATLQKSGTAITMDMPAGSTIAGKNLVKAFGRIEWVGGVPTLLSQSHNIFSINADEVSVTGRVNVDFADPNLISDDNPVITIGVHSSTGTGSTVEISLDENGRAKFDGFEGDTRARVNFSFAVYGDG